MQQQRDFYSIHFHRHKGEVCPKRGLPGCIPPPSIKANQMTASSNSSAFKPMRSRNHGAALGFKISAGSPSDSPACLANGKANENVLLILHRPITSDGGKRDCSSGELSSKRSKS
ncbi:hypothetical protein SRHO_G00334160 [Serrasalmus rhombeus]